jgi:hypothetical protein
MGSVLFLLHAERERNKKMAKKKGSVFITI